MTGHRPDQPGSQDPSDSASPSAGADVSADEFAAALKLIVKRLEGQDDDAETPPPGRDSDDIATATPTSAALNSASQPAAKDPLWTGLSDSLPADPDPAPSDSATFALNASGDPATGNRPPGAAPADDDWPAASPATDDSSVQDYEPAAFQTGEYDPAADPPEEYEPARDPLFSNAPEEPDPLLAEKPVRAGGDPLFAPRSESPPDPLFAEESSDGDLSDDRPARADAAAAETGKEPLFVDTPSPKEPLFADTPAAKEPLFVDSPAPADKEPLFVDTQAPKEPLFVDTPSAADTDPLFVEKPKPSPQDSFAIESAQAEAGGNDAPPEDPMAALLNRDTGPTIGPAMPAPEPPQPASTPPDSALDYPDPATPNSEPSASPPRGEDIAEPPAGSTGDPFAAAARPAFEDDRANALFGDAPDLAAQNAPGSSLGPIGAESAEFGKPDPLDPSTDALTARRIDEEPGDSAGALSASREPDDDGEVELDQILPPLDPATGSLEKAAGPPKPRRPLRVGAPAFWLLILALFGGMSYWGFQQRRQAVELGEWAQARFNPPTGSLATLLPGRSSEPDGPGATPEATGEPPPAPQVATLPPAPDPAPAEPPAASPAPEPIPAPAPEPAPAVAAATPPPAPEPPPAPAPVAAPEPVDAAAGAPPRLPDHLAPLPPDVAPEIRSLADRALSGDPLAQHDLGNQYAVGETVAQSNAYAAYWYRLASEADIPNAQYNLGVLTARGLGVRKDLEAAFRLFLTAAEAGHADAQTAAGLAYMYGSGVSQDRLQAASWFQAASANGRPRGAFHLGQLFEAGLDEAPDLAAAAGWYRIAADAGYSQAREALDRLTAASRPATPAPAPAPSTVAAPAATPAPLPPSPPPVLGPPSELVREIQQRLNALGYDAGPEDGRMGEKTREAILTFQRSQGLNVTGEATRGTLELLNIVSGR